MSVREIKPPTCASCGGTIQASVIRTTYWTFRDDTGRIYAERAFPIGDDYVDVRIYCENDCRGEALGLSVDQQMALAAMARASEASVR